MICWWQHQPASSSDLAPLDVHVTLFGVKSRECAVPRDYDLTLVLVAPPGGAATTGAVRAGTYQAQASVRRAKKGVRESQRRVAMTSAKASSAVSARLCRRRQRASSGITAANTQASSDTNAPAAASRAGHNALLSNITKSITQLTMQKARYKSVDLRTNVQPRKYAALKKIILDLTLTTQY